MKKFMMTALALMVSSTAMAANDHAVLNVEGEIQINGKTVIDQEGNWTGNQTNNLINIAEYVVPVGLARVELQKQGDSALEYHLSYDPATDSATKEETLVNGEVKWTQEWIERTDTSNKIRTTDVTWSDEAGYVTCTDIVANTFSASTTYPSVELGKLTARGDVYTSEVTENDCAPELVGNKTQNYLSMAMIVTAETSYTYGQETLENCIYVSQINSWSDTNQARVYCKGVGMVAFDDYVLKAIIK
ncbi:hypothetical protein L4D06_01245 [Enterovibrio makurazakiensis]|uniref:hypothetical protein n=1 Tax=Enterovibrio makurazakiensis TaxID=2910232 RepID=UPI003D1C0865